MIKTALTLTALALTLSTARAQQATTPVPAPVADPATAEATSALGLETDPPPSLSLDDGKENYVAPDFCGPGDAGHVEVQEPNGTFEPDENGAPITFNAMTVKNFVCEILPVAIHMDRIVFGQRRYVEYLSKLVTLLPSQETWLSQLATEYRLPADATPSEILERVDIVPIPMLLAQGGIESTWGQSRFAVAPGFNFFGIHGAGNAGCTMSASTPPVCVAKYSDLGAGVSAYIAWMNTQVSQAPFWQARQAARAAQGDVSVPLNSIDMAQTMSKYSQIGAAYAQRIITVITDFHLAQFAFDEQKMPPIDPAAQSSSAALP